MSPALAGRFFTNEAPGKPQYLAFCICFLSLGMFSRIIHRLAGISTSFLFVVEYYSTVWIYIYFIQSLADRNLDSFLFVVITKNAIVNIHVLVFVWMYVFLLGGKQLGVE